MKSFLLVLVIFAGFFKINAQDRVDFLEFNAASFRSSGVSDADLYSFKGKTYFAIKTADLNIQFPLELNKEAYLGDGIFLVSSTDDFFKQLLPNNSFKIGRLAYQSKINTFLKPENSTSIFAINNQEKEKVLVSFIGDLTENEITQYLASKGIELDGFKADFKQFSVFISKEQVEELALMPFVRYISPKLNYPTPLLGSGIGQNRVNAVQYKGPSGFGLLGQGINIGQWDESTVGPHLDFEQRIFNNDKLDSDLATNTHATGVAGMINGGGIFSEYSKGMAPKSMLYSWDFRGDILSELRAGIVNSQLSVTNHSYYLGIFSVPYNCSEPPGLYVTETSELDKIAKDNEYVTHIFSVGNSFTGCGTDGSVVPGFQGAKNIIDVGLVDAVDVHITSSVGPTYDGRLKPEIVALGYNVFGLRRYNSFTKYFGSSFASPMIAGIVGLMQEQYKKDHAGAYPKSSLVKALLCNTAFDLGFSGPDYRHGFGRVNANKALKALVSNNYEFGMINNEQTNIVGLSVPSGAKTLKVMIAWNDPATTLPATKILVNDLDLEILDPNGQTVLPWVLGKNNDDIAVRGRDSLNNIEQITIDNPIAGNYSIIIKGKSIPFGPQEYALVKWVEASNIEITNPMPAERVAYNALGSSLYIRFEAVGTGNLTIEYSKDDGANWSVLATNIPPTQSYLSWPIDPTITETAKIRISDGTTTTIQSFAVVKLPTGLTATSCDRTVNLSWQDEPNATFKILMYKDTGYVQVGTTDTNFYRVSNLQNGITSLFSIISVTNGKESPRADAIFGTPNPGICPVPNDVGVVGLIAPFGGRLNTSTALTATTNFTARIKNFGNTKVANIGVNLNINGANFNASILDSIAPDSTKDVQFVGTSNLSAIGNYPYTLTTNLTSDGNKNNDTVKGVLYQLAHNPAVLPYFEGFEDMPKCGITDNAFRVLDNDEWDYTTDKFGGRFRVGESDFFAISGKKGATFDNSLAVVPTENNLILNLNLSNYADSLIYLDFSALSHNELTALDFIYVRGKETDNWIKVFDIFANKGPKALFKSFQGLNISKMLITDSASNFSASSQIRFSFNTSKKALFTNQTGGYSIDEIKLYNAGRDIGIEGISYNRFICGGGTNYIISLKGKNNDIYSNGNFALKYSINDGPIVSQVFTQTLLPQDTFAFTFSQNADLSLPGIYKIKVWTSNPGDLAAFNDTILYVVNVLNSVSNFPYFENFESNNGNLISDAGGETKWEWGIPNKNKIYLSGQGNKAWVTNLREKYKNNEETTLYLGCYNFSALTQPIINFNTYQNIETGEIGQGLYDYVVAESSLDGNTWGRLGAIGSGYNWYENIQDSAVWDLDSLPWQVVSQKIDLNGISDKSKYMIRLRFKSDIAETREGMAIDDLFITEFLDSIVEKDSTVVSVVSNSEGWVDYRKNGQLIGSFYNDGQQLGTLKMGLLTNETNEISIFKNRRLLPRRFFVWPENELTGNYKVRLFFKNDEYFALNNSDKGINRPGDLVVLKYNGLNTDLDLTNNAFSDYLLLNENEVEIIPYLDGYFVEFETSDFGEYYIVGNKIDIALLDSTQIIAFDAVKNTSNQSVLSWTSAKENQVVKYITTYSLDDINYIPFDSVLAININGVNTNYSAIDSVSDRLDKLMYYKLWYRTTNDSLVYVGLQTVDYTLSAVNNIQNGGLELRGWQLISKLNNPFEANIYFYGIDGKLINTFTQAIDNGINDFSFLNNGKLAVGTYLLKIEKSKTESVVGKVVVLK